MTDYPHTFRSPYTVDVPLPNGTPVRILAAVTEPDDEHDAECLPMYLLETPDGRTAEAYPEEIDPSPAA